MRHPETADWDLPIKFPSDADVIVEEVARFRAMPEEKRMQWIRELFGAGMLMIRQSPKAALLREYTLEHEIRAHQAVTEFLARHGS
jgi:hypothetical protein